MSELAKVAVVVLTLNRWQDTYECITSIYAGEHGGCRVIVVDNCSSDGTPDRVRAQFPNAQLVLNHANLGYAEGNNVGIRAALREGAEYILVLNNDVLVAPDALTRLVQAARQQPGSALVGPLVLHADEPTIIQSAGGILAADWRARHRGANEQNEGQFSAVEPVDWLTGCAVLVRSAALQGIGLLDADFYMYGEDVDWGVRARQAGCSVLFVPQAKVWHKGVTRDYAPSPRVTYYSARNELQLMRKHHAGAAALARAYARQLRTLTSWTVRPAWQAKRAHRNALARALFDSARGASGPAFLV